MPPKKTGAKANAKGRTNLPKINPPSETLLQKSESTVALPRIEPSVEQPLEAKSASKPPKETVMNVFTRFDLNGDGLIKVDELANVFKVLAPGRMTDRAITRLFDAMDMDSDGAVSVEEFVDFIFDEDGGSKAFRGAIELAGTTAGARTLSWSLGTPSHLSFSFDVAKELELVRETDVATEIRTLRAEDLEMIASMPIVADPVRRVLEAVSLILAPSQGRLTSLDTLNAPEWNELQELLREPSALQRIINFDARKAELRKRPMWAAWIVKKYFKTSDEDLEQRPLTHGQVSTACSVQFALQDVSESALMKLYRWVLRLLERELMELLAQ